MSGCPFFAEILFFFHALFRSEIVIVFDTAQTLWVRSGFFYLLGTINFYQNRFIYNFVLFHPQIFSLHLGHDLRVIFLTLTYVCVRADAQGHVDVSVCHVTPPSGTK